MTESQFQGMKIVLLVKAVCTPSSAFWFSVKYLCRFFAHLVCLLPREMTGQFGESTAVSGVQNLHGILLALFKCHGLFFPLSVCWNFACSRFQWNYSLSELTYSLGPMQSPSHHSINYVVVLGFHSKITRTDSDFPTCSEHPVMDSLALNFHSDI